MFVNFCQFFVNFLSLVNFAVSLDAKKAEISKIDKKLLYIA